MLSALIIQNLGMAWTFYIVAIVIFVVSIGMFFFMPETMYLGHRPHLTFHHDEDERDAATRKPPQAASQIEVTDNSSQALHVPKKSFVQEFSFWGINDRHVSLWQAFARPFVLLAYPTIVWSCCCYGAALSWNVILAVTNGQLFSPA